MYSLRAIQNRLMIGAAMFISVFSLERPGPGQRRGEYCEFPTGSMSCPTWGADNTVLVYDRADDGTLTFLQKFPPAALAAAPANSLAVASLPGPDPVGFPGRTHQNPGRPIPDRRERRQQRYSGPGNHPRWIDPGR